MKYLITILLLLPAIGRAQDAVVVQLTSEEAAQARALHAEAAEAQKAWDNYWAHIEKKYTMTSGDTCDFSIKNYFLADESPEKPKHCAIVKEEWRNATMEFTNDFRFIVPKPVPSAQQCIGVNCWVTITPAQVFKGL